MKKSLIALALTGLLVGCGNTVITKKEYVYVGLPKTATERVQPSTPPERDVYLKSTDKERVKLLRDLSDKLYAELEIANGRLFTIEELDLKNKRDIELRNKESK